MCGQRNSLRFAICSSRRTLQNIIAVAAAERESARMVLKTSRALLISFVWEDRERELGAGCAECGGL